MELTGVWPPLPIILDRFIYDIDAAIAYHNRICEINLISLRGWQLKRLASTMQVQFPALTDLRLHFDDLESPAVLPDGFLSGSAPLLRSLDLHSIPFPGLPNLLLSATRLVSLTLINIPPSGFSPEKVVTTLAVLTNLKSLIIEFASPPSRHDPESRRPPPPTRIVLPVLTRLELQVDSKYLEDVLVRVDVPLLDSICITFFDQHRFDIPQLARFMRRMTRLQAHNETHVDFYLSREFSCCGIQVGSLPPTRSSDDKSKLRIISNGSKDGLLSSLAQVCTSFFPSIYMVEHLHFHELPRQWDYDAENLPWLEIFHPFTAVKSLYLSRDFARFIAFALQDLIGERVMDVLPALESLYLEHLRPRALGSVQEAIGPFVAARQLLGHPVAVSYGKREAL
jgi:hypothetical protein